jgi:uncharacterized protein (DUF983 family)
MSETDALPATLNKTVREQLHDTACPQCEAGMLVDGTYKGEYALVCTSCDVPLYRPI